MYIHNNGWKQTQRENQEKPYIILNHNNNYYAGLQKVGEGVLLGLSRCTLNNVEFSVIK